MALWGCKSCQPSKTCQVIGVIGNRHYRFDEDVSGSAVRFFYPTAETDDSTLTIDVPGLTKDRLYTKGRD